MSTPYEFGDRTDDLSDRAKREFIEFLSDAKPPMFVADALSYLLRTEPPLHVDPSEPVEIIAAWSEDQARTARQPLSVVMLNALRRILDAHRLGVIKGFDPEAFFRVVAPGLAAHCETSEAAGFQAGLRDLQVSIPRRTQGRPETVPDGDVVVIRGQRRSVKSAQELTIARLEHEAYMPDADFEEAYEDLQIALSSRLGIPIHTALSRVARAAASIFNTGRVNQSRRLFEFVETSFERLAISPEGRNEVRFSVTENELNEGLLGKVLNDPEQRVAAGPIVHAVGYLNPAEALITLGIEGRRDRRRLLLNAIEAYGSGAYPTILDHLSASSSTKQPWYLKRNLLFLLSRLDAQDDTDRRRAIELVGRYVTNDVPQLRAAAVGALRRIGGKECVPYAVRALDPAAYPAGSIDDTDALKRHLVTAMEALVETGNEAAITIVCEIATGARGAEFDLGASLRDEAVNALSHRKAPLPRRAALVIVTALQGVVGKRFKIVTGMLSFGVDPHLCKQLSGLLHDSREPEAIEVLAHPTLAKVQSLAG